MADYYRIRTPEDGKLIERTFSHGSFSSALGHGPVSKEHERVREQARQGVDPVKARYVLKANKVAAGEDTFDAVAREWMADRTRWSATHRQKSVRALERDVFPYLGKLAVGEITPAMVSKVIEHWRRPVGWGRICAVGLARVVSSRQRNVSLWKPKSSPPSSSTRSEAAGSTLATRRRARRSPRAMRSGRSRGQGGRRARSAAGL